MLDCGHRCPSVCGEDCSIQTCPTCDPSDDIVDMILARTMADIDPDMETVDDMLITIPICEHVFTVETLDGHCDMSSYYERSSDETQWIGLKAPPANFRKPPTCPTCRSAITCPRYGRVFKRADLDILENNVASAMSQSLEKVADKVHQASSQPLKDRLKIAAVEFRTNLTKAGAIGNLKERKAKQKGILKEIRNKPLTSAHVDPGNALHGVPTIEVNPWRNVVNILLTAYRDAWTVASTRSAHIHAWEASFSYLFKKEMESAAADPDHAPRNPEEHAMRMARMNVGQPQPRADSRFCVEAFWMTINIRLTLVELAKTWVDQLSSDVPNNDAKSNRQLWDNYVSFLLLSCKQDAVITLGITQNSDSHRQTVRTNLLLLRIELEQFRFNVDMMRSRENFTLEARKELADRAHTKGQETRIQVDSVLKEHRQRNRTDVEWLRDNFKAPSQVILGEWLNVETSLRRDTFYAPVSLEEMTDIVKALNFSHRGHFYKCPKGHTFVITECGGAMESSRCPECGEAIGGSGHDLLATNTRDTEFETLAAAQGAQASPWAWARGA